MKVALLSNVTTSILEGMLGKECSVWSPPGFGAWVETSLSIPQGLVDFGPEVIYLLLDDHFGDYDKSFVDGVVARLRVRFAGVPVVVPDLSRMAADFGDKFYDERMWKLGKLPWSMVGLREIKRLIVPVKKVLAVDLDNTLWDGVIGEEGIKGVKPNGDLIRQLLKLKNRGVLLVILSKNNPEDVEPAFIEVLSRHDFVAVRLNWDPKPDNLAKVAADLNLGVDAFVFLDDNPAERVQMRALQPEVCVASFPPRLEDYFPPRELTKEDADKTAQYQAEAKRKELAAGLSFEEYLASLEIRTDIHPILEGEILRVAQLSQKTNQFNVCTNRYSESEIRKFSVAENRFLVTLHARDRFGDQGLVAFVNVLIDGRQAEITDWVMSCRAMNRRVEFAVEEWVEASLGARGVVELKASWHKTPKNAPVRELFDHFGFELVDESETVRHYRKVIDREH